MYRGVVASKHPRIRNSLLVALADFLHAEHRKLPLDLLKLCLPFSNNLAERVISTPARARERVLAASELEKVFEETHVTYGSLFPAGSSIALRIQARRPRPPKAIFFFATLKIVYSV